MNLSEKLTELAQKSQAPDTVVVVLAPARRVEPIRKCCTDVLFIYLLCLVLGK